MELTIVIFGVFLLGVHNAASYYEDGDIQFILDYDGSRQTTVHNLKKAVRRLLRSEDPESIAVTFNNTDVKIWHINIRSDYDYASNDNPGVMSMTGILSALQYSPPESPLWVFTDKPVKDPVKLHEVVYMSQKMGNPIYFAIFRPCNHSITPALGFYQDVATATNGQVFYLQKNETGELLNYEEHLRSRPKDIITKTFWPDVENNEFSVTVDRKMSELMIAVTGEDDEEPVVTLTDPSGLAVATTDVTRLSAITVVKSPVSPGVYKVRVSCQQKTRVVVTAFTSLTFRFGFSAHTPSHFNEISRVPVPGTGYISISLDDDEGLQLRTVQILDMEYTVLVEEPVKHVLSVIESGTTHFYTTDPISIPDHPFQIAIIIHDASSGTNVTRRGSTPITPSLPYKCRQPKEEGPCRGVVPSWFFDNAIKECRQFMYGGCLGNENRFTSQAECARECWAVLQPNPASKSNICAENEFACSKNPIPFCIRDSWVCDGSKDCPLGEDEEIDTCRNHPCLPPRFRCPSGKCLSQSWVCDGENDCTDTEASDEQNCTTSHHWPPHRPGNAEVRSTDKCQQPMDAGPCRAQLPRWYYDNSLKQCRRFVFSGCRGNANRFISEAACHHECGARAVPDPPTPEMTGDNGIQNPASKTNICDVNQFACKNAMCILDAWVCDGDRDCPGGEDEEIDKCRRTNNPCPPNTFRCPNGKCLFQSWVCDGQNDCFDLEASDEQNCTISPTTPTPRPEIAEVPSTGKCLSWMVTCGNNNCIPNWWRCDGMNDCGDNSDEVGCANDKCLQPMVQGPCRAEIPMWYYDNSLDMCLLFGYSGCGGNDNRFDSDAECRGQCVDRVQINKPTSNTTEQQNREPAATEKTPKMPTNVTCRQRDDELETFGRYVASSLRKLNVKVAINAQDDIQRILSKYKLRNLKRTSN